MDSSIKTNLPMTEIIEFNKDKIDRFSYSNSLIEANYSLSTEQHRIIFTMAQMIHPDDVEFKEYKINIREFAKHFGIKGESVVEHVKKVAKQLVGKTLTIKDKARKQTIFMNWLSSAIVPEKGSGNDVVLTFDPKMKPFLLQIKGGFTFLENKQITRLKGKYALRIYMLLKQYLSFGERTFSIADLREKLDLKADDYVRLYDFKKVVIDRSVTEINNVTDLYVEVKDGHKIGKRVIELVFTYHQKSGEEVGRVIGVNNDKNGENEKIGGIRENDDKNGDLNNDIFGGEKGGKKNDKIGEGKNGTQDELKAYHEEKGYKSDFENFWILNESTGWSGIKNRFAWLDGFEKNFRDKNPEKYQEPKMAGAAIVKDPQEEKIKEVRSRIKFALNSEFGTEEEVKIWIRFFDGMPIAKDGDGFVISVKNSEALQYQEILSNINVKIEVMNANS